MMTSDSCVSKLYQETEAMHGKRQVTSGKLFLRSIVVSKLVADLFLCITIAYVARSLLFHASYATKYSFGNELVVIGATALFSTLLLQRKVTYTGLTSLDPVRETADAIRMATQCFVFVMPASLFLRLAFPGSVTVLALVLMPPLSALQTKLFRRIILKMPSVIKVRRSAEDGVASRSKEIGITKVITDEGQKSPSRHYALSKRAVDLALSSILLVFFTPIFVLFALLICISSPGPALFVQNRVGRNGKIFRMYKFRSMSFNTRKYEFSPQTSSDPRITKIGRALRQTSLDELPQLINVFLGDMSLVGPRPEMPFIVRGYNLRQRQRLQVMPGITGLWQLSRDRAFPIHQNIHHDLLYIGDRSLCMDLAILIHTLFFAMRGGV